MMNNEIKEILDKLENIDNYDYSEELDNKGNLLNKSYDIYLSKEETDKLLDYITNLQEENKRYKRIFKGKERFSKIMPDDTDFIILLKADYDRQQEDIELGLIDYKSRSEKAIEELDKYINSCEIEAEHTLDNEKCLISVRHSKKIKNILQGEDKDE